MQGLSARIAFDHLWSDRTGFVELSRVPDATWKFARKAFDTQQDAITAARLVNDAMGTPIGVVRSAYNATAPVGSPGDEVSYFLIAMSATAGGNVDPASMTSDAAAWKGELQPSAADPSARELLDPRTKLAGVAVMDTAPAAFGYRLNAIQAILVGEHELVRDGNNWASTRAPS